MMRTTTMYSNVNSRPFSIATRRFISVEAQPSRVHHHRRVIGAPPSLAQLRGKPLIYVDTIRGRAKDEVYGYARHSVSASDLLHAVNDFLAGFLAYAVEMQTRSFPVRMNIGGKLIEDSWSFPFDPYFPIGEDLQFMRIDFRFGSVAAEFGDPQPESEDQNDWLYADRIPRRIERPLIGCDFSEGTDFAPLISSVHWARPYVPVQLLNEIITEVIPHGVEV